MILKALYDYYQRDIDSVPFGLQLQSISFVIVIDKHGNFCHIEDCRQGRSGTNFLVPTGSHNNGVSPLLFWDNVMYMLNYVPEDDIKESELSEKQKETIKKARNKHAAFIERCINIADIICEEDLLAVKQFYLSNQLNNVYEDSLWNDVKATKAWLSFRIKGNKRIVPENKELLKYNCNDIGNENGVCLITGKKTSIVRLCTDTPIAGSKNSAKLVSFNNESFCSYNKKQCSNSPISPEAEFSFSSAFKKLISKDSKNKFILGNRTFLFWASNSNESGHKAEESLWSMLGFQENEDDPNRRILQVREVFNSIYSGQLTTSLDDKFYILGLAPNSARIAVSYWAEIPLKEFASLILRHFDDMDIIDTREEKKPYFGLRSILSSVTLGGKVSDVTPNLPEALVKSIFQGLPYPQTLYSSCIRRIRAENNIGITRAAIIKAYLNRLNNQEKLNTTLDKENKNQGYLCGRLFAVLDKIQGDANSQHSIKERYMNATSSTPATVFATIINLSSHHSEKLNEGRKVFYEKLKQEIVDKISADGFPSHLDLQDQGSFFVGYYHQQQEFYVKKEETNDKKQHTMLDKENKNKGYLCGRLFAVLDKIQSDANGQHSIKERYMNAASATPATVFATIINLSSHHSEKLNEGRKVFYEKLKQEIVDKISADGFPSHLDLQDQGRFFVGYYHQQQAFYVKNEEINENNG